MTGKCEILKNGSWTALALGQKLSQNSEIRTGPKGKLDIKVPLGKLRLLGNTNVTIQQLTANTNDLKANNGNILAKVLKLGPGQKYRVETPTVVAGVRGTQFWGQVNKEEETGTFAVREGSVEITRKSDNMKVTIKKGQALDLKPGAHKLKVRDAKKGEMGAMAQIEEM